MGAVGQGGGGAAATGRDAIALFSDVHANLPALRAVLEDIRRRGIARRYCLGDLVGYGADPNGVIDLLAGSGVPSVLGNYDDGIGWERGDCGCYYPDELSRQIGAASYAFTVATVTPERKAYLRDLPRDLHVGLADKRVHLVHGSPRRVNEYLLQDRDERTFLRLAAVETDHVLAFGHTHEAWYRRYEDTLFVGVGSVGRPKDGDPRAAWVLLESEWAGPIRVTILRVDYAVEEAAAAVEAAGLPSALADKLRRGL